MSDVFKTVDSINPKTPNGAAVQTNMNDNELATSNQDNSSVSFRELDFASNSTEPYERWLGFYIVDNTDIKTTGLRGVGLYRTNPNASDDIDINQISIFIGILSQNQNRYSLIVDSENGNRGRVNSDDIEI